MATERTRRVRPIDVLGGLCLVGTLALTSFVNAVRANDGETPNMSIDPSLVRRQAEAPTPVAEQPQIIHLNTRGYNYGPPPAEIEPAAIHYERGIAPTAPPAPAAPAPASAQDPTASR